MKRFFNGKKILMFSIIGILAASILVTILSKTTNIFSTNNLKTTEQAASVSLDNVTITTNKPIVKTSDYPIDGKEIINKASELLGKGYGFGSKGATDPYGSYKLLSKDKFTHIDCTGLVYWTLGNLGVKTSGYSLNNPIPVDTTHYVTYGTPNSYYFFNEVKYWKDSNNDSKIDTTISKNSTGKSVRNANLKYTKGNSSYDINVLKINDPVTSSLRYYQYYDENDQIKYLPTGTVVIALGEVLGGNYESHAWIYIGDLGTTDPNEVYEILKANGINVSKDYIISETSSTHWRIESRSGNGVVITNTDPTYGSKTSDGKAVGPIWAFQFADDYEIKVPGGKYHLNIAKRSTDNNNELSNKQGGIADVTIKVTQKVYNKEETTQTITTNANASNNSIFGDTVITDFGAGKPDRYQITEISGAQGYKTIDLSDITFDVYKKVSKNDSLKYVIDYVRINKNGNEIGRVTNDEGTSNNEGTFKIDADDLYDIGIELSKNGDELCITVRNKPMEGLYNVQLTKYSENNSSTKLSGAKFDYKVYKDVSEGDIQDIIKGNATTKTMNYNNNDKMYHADSTTITKSNTSDIWVIEEMTPPEGHILSKIKNTYFRVFKKEQNGKYVVEKVAVYGQKNGAPQGSEFINPSEAVYIDAEGNVSKTAISNYSIRVALGEGGGIIEVIYKNPLITGSYNVQLTKYSENDSNTKLSGAKFDYKIYKNVSEGDVKDIINGDADTKAMSYNNNDKMYHADTTSITGTNTTDIWAIEEVTPPEGHAFSKIKNVYFRVFKKEQNGKYIIEKVAVYGQKDGELQDFEFINPKETVYIDANGNISKTSTTNYSIRVTLGEDEGTIGVIYKNPITEVSLNLNKVDADNNSEFIEGAKFTVYGPNNAIILNNQTLETNGNGVGKLKNNIKNLKTDTWYYYDIFEESAPLGYKNIFEKYENVDGIRIAFKINKSGELEISQRSDGRNYYFIKKDESNAKVYPELAECINVSSEGNTINVTMENPKDTKDVQIVLNKSLLGTETQFINSEFAVKEIGNEQNSKTVNVTKNTEIDKKDKIVLNGNHTYHYEIIENRIINTSTAAHIGKIKGARFKVYVDISGNLSAEITEIYHQGINEDSYSWKRKISVEDWQKYLDIKCTGATTGNGLGIVNVYMKNPAEYDFTLYKKDFSSNTDLANATFKIEKIVGSNSSVIYEGKLANATAAFSEKEVSANSTYTYKITETAAPVGYYNTLVNKPIILTIRTDNLGKLKNIANTGSNWEFDPSLNLSEKDLDILNKLVDLKIDANNKKIDLHIANMPMNYYALQLVKVDNKGNVITNQEAKFYVKQQSSNPATQGFEKGTEQEGVSTTKGVLNITEKLLIEGTHTHTYTIKETHAPAGYQRLDGSITAKVRFSADNRINSWEAVYYDANGVNKDINLKGEFSESTGIPTIFIYIPNDSELLEFELLKQDFEGNNIKAEKRNDGSLNGAYFNINRMRLLTREGSSQNDMNSYREISKIFDNSTIVNDVLKNGSINDIVPMYQNFTYIYQILEVDAKDGYTNILKDKFILLYVDTKLNTDTNKPEIEHVDYKVYDTAKGSTDITEEFKNKYGHYIETKFINNKVSIIIKNTPGYKVRLTKTDTNDNPIKNAVLQAEFDGKVQGALNVHTDEFGNQQVNFIDTTSISTNSIAIRPGEEQVWKIYERMAQIPYQNILQDKYIEVVVTMDSEGNLSVKNWTVKNVSNNQELSSSELYDIKKYISEIAFVKEGIDDVLHVKIKNPVKYALAITKYEADGITELSGATVKLNDNTVIGNGNSTYYEVIEHSDITETKNYKITETATTVNHINLLDGKYINISVKLNSKNEIVYNYQIYNNDNTLIKSDNYIYNYVEITESIENNIPTIKVKILNPSKLKFEVTKVNTSGTPIAGVSFRVKSPILNSSNINSDYLDRSNIRSMNKNGYYYAETKDNGTFYFEDGSLVQGIYEYEIRETDVSSPYLNLFKDYKIYVKINIDNNGKIVLGNYNNGKKFEIRDQNGNIAPDSYYQYVKDPYIETINNVQCIKVKIENPVQYKFKLNKSMYSKDAINLSNTVFEIDGKEYKTDSNGNIQFTNGAISEGIHEIIIKEKATASDDIVNILDGHYIKIKVKVFANGEIKTLSASNVETTNSYTIHKDDGKGTIVSFNNTKIDDFVKVDTTKKDKDVSILNVSITNPQEYGLIIKKKDAATGLFLNDVNFSAKLLDESGNEIKVIDTETFTSKDLKNLKTQNVNGEDGVIKVDNILVERAGSYTLVINEEKLEKYISVDDIYIDYNIEIQCERYEITNISVRNPEHVNTEITKLVKEVNKNLTYIQVGVDNIPVTGNYEIDLVKVDKNTKQKLDGAKFSISNSNIPQAIRSEVSTDKAGHLSITNGLVNIVSDDTEITSDNQTKVKTIDEYKISELSLDSYLILKNDLTLQVFKERIDDSYVATKMTVTESNTLKTATVDFRNNSKVTIKGLSLKNSTVTVNLTIKAIDGNKFVLEVENAPITGKYMLELQKYDTLNNKLSNIPFKINNKTVRTNENGEICATGSLSTQTGWYNITKSNVNTVDVYKIEEIKTEETSKYSLLTAPITLSISKGLNAKGSDYIATNINVVYTNSEGEKTIDIPVNTTSQTAYKTFRVLTKDGTLVMAKIAMTNEGKITLELKNPEKEGYYEFKLYKYVIDENNEQSPLEGAQFNVDKNGTSEEKNTDSTGHIPTIVTNIDSTNWRNTDVYTITEITAGADGIIKLKNPLEVSITKKETDSEYKLNTIKLTEKNTNKTTGIVTISENESTELSLAEVMLEDGRTVDITGQVTPYGFVNISVANRKATGKFTVKINKINSVTGEAINGVIFSGLDDKKAPYTITTENGIATIVKDKEIINGASYDYSIEEIGLPESLKSELLKITDYGLLLKVNTKLNSDKTKYIIDKENTTISSYRKNNNASESQNRQKEIIDRAVESMKIDSDGTTITLTLENEPIKTFNFNIKKVSVEDDSLISDAKFTITENDVVILQNATLGQFGEYLISRENVLINSSYVYKIKETSAGKGFDNHFEKAYLQVVINIDEKGIVSASSNINIDYNAGGDIYDRILAQEVISDYLTNNPGKKILEDNGNNSYTLNIPNPVSTVDFDFNLLKHEFNAKNKGVDGAEFSVSRVKFEDDVTEKTLDELVNIFENKTNVENLNNITTSKDTLSLAMDNQEDVKVNTTYYYEITETKVQTNYKSTYKKAIVRISVDIDGNITSKVIGISNSTNYSSYVTYTNEHSNIINCTIDGSSIDLSWANSMVYVIRMNKKQYLGSMDKVISGDVDWASMQPLPGATFTVTQKSPQNKVIYDNETLSTVEFFSNEEANGGTVYRYEIVENATRDGYHNLFEGMVITLQITTNLDGTINTAESETFIKVEEDLNTSVSEEKLNLANDSIGLAINDNIVDVFIANKEKTLDISILKLSDTDINGRALGIEGVSFNVIDFDRNMSLYDVNGNNTTDADGYLNISGLEIRNKVQRYIISESSVPEGVTKLANTEIWLEIDTRNVTDAAQLTAENIKATLNATGAGGVTVLEGLHVELVGTTVLLSIPNPAKSYVFTFVKKDEAGNLIASDSENDGARFKITKYKRLNNLTTNEVNGILKAGFYADGEIAAPNTEYKYTIEELKAKDGYINILQGYKLELSIVTDSNANVRNDGSTSYQLVEKDGEEQLFTREEVQEMISYTVRVGEKESFIDISIVNPYSYKLQLNKKSSDGSLDVDAATLVAQRVNNARAHDLFTETTNRAQILKEIINSTNTSNKITLDKASTIISDDILIKNNIGGMPADNTTQTWKITETNADAPYVNILKDKYLIVQTMYKINNGLQVVSHPDATVQGLVNFYVCDSEGNDVTAEYVNYIEVSAEKVDGDWRLIVTVKDPMKFYVGLNKVENCDIDTDTQDLVPLKGAELTITSSNGSADITNGESESELIMNQVNPASTVQFTINELRSAPGHENILKDKSLIVVARIDESGEVSVADTAIIDKANNGNQLSGDAYKEIMKYIQYEITTSQDGYPLINIYVKNPIIFELDLVKNDILRNQLGGANIEVISSKSGTYYSEGNPEIGIVETGLKPGDRFSYQIKEVNTVENSAFINKFKNPIVFTIRISENGIASIISKSQIIDGRPEPFNTLEYLDYTLTELTNTVDRQRLIIKMQNPPKVDFELEKITAGEHPVVIPNTGFTIISKEKHEDITDKNGKINFSEEISNIGTYTYRITETSKANDKYINVLENMYMKVDVDISANGYMTIIGTPTYYYLDNDSIYDNDVQVEADIAQKLANYTSAEVDRSKPINKLKVKVENPVKVKLDILKETTNGKKLPNAKFEILSEITGTHSGTTDENGNISINETWVTPGVYKYEITEKLPAGNQYDNILKDHKIVVYAKVSEKGNITLVKDENGTAFASSVVIAQRYIIERQDGAEVDIETEDLIRSHVSVAEEHSSTTVDSISVIVENPVNYKVNIIKSQYQNQNKDTINLAGAIFTVTKNSKETVLDHKEITTEVEIKENYVSNGKNYYDITENSTADGAYINILEGKFIRVYTEITDTGVLKIEDANGNDDLEYFEIYEYQKAGPARVLDRRDNVELYNLISVNSIRDSNGVYTLNVKVINPININVELQKKQVDNMPLENTAFTIISNHSGNHTENTDLRGIIDFTEETILPGNYDYIVKENKVAGPKYVNILENRYMKVAVNVSKEGRITIKDIEYYADNKNNDYTDDTQITDSSILAMLQKYSSVKVDTSSNTQKLQFVIKNPLTMDFEVVKTKINDEELAGANFTINRFNISSEGSNSVTKDTNSDGLILINEEIMDPGIYKYEVTENESADTQYENILKGYKVVIFVRLHANGVVDLVADENGTAFARGTKYFYSVESLNGSNIANDVIERIHKYVGVSKTNNSDSYDKVTIKVENPISYKLDLIKKTPQGDNLEGTKFSVVRDNDITILDNIFVTQNVELTEKDIENGDHVFYITEDSSVENGGYINALDGKFIKVYTDITAEGVLTIRNNAGNAIGDYFEIYEGYSYDIANAKLLDKSENAELYNLVKVEAIKGSDKVYTLKVTVENPERNYKVTLNKKIFGEENLNLANTEFEIISEVTKQRKTYTTDKDGNLSFEERIVPAGTYQYLITETKSAGEEIVNILDDMYVKVLLKVNEDGTLEIVEEDANKYSLYEKAEGSNISKVDFANTLVDNYVNVSTNNDVDMPEMNVFVKDPSFYNFELIKKDKDTNERMNNVRFTITTLGPDGKEVDLVDVNTLEKIIDGKLMTKNVDGVDGVLQIPNILVEKTGTYTFIFHEESTDGIFDVLYKSWAEDVRVEVQISVVDGKYVVSTPKISTGSKYVEQVQTTTTKAQTAKVEVLNERIKGSYSLTLNKLDSYTRKKLDGAEFNIAVEKDGKSYQLYESTDDVTSKNVIIPNSYVVENGELTIENIRIERPEEYTIILTETKAPKGYMLLDNPIKVRVRTTRSGVADDEIYILETADLVDDQNHGLIKVSNDDELIKIEAKNEYFDLALRKSITSVAYSDSDDAKITEDETKDRVPDVITEKLVKNDGTTTADYNHVKNHVRSYVSQEVIFTLRVYNEGEIDGYAEEITDHLPEGLEFVNDDFNAARGWKLDPSDTTLRTVKTTYLSKENNPNNETYNSENNLIKAMDKSTGVLDYKEIQIKCRIADDVKADTVLTNIAEISLSKAEDRSQETVDRDSVTNNVKVPESSEEMSDYNEDQLTDNRNDYVPGQEDDDDFEKLIVEEFDLALRKYIVAVNDEELLRDNTNNAEDENNKDTEDENSENTEDKTEEVDGENSENKEDNANDLANDNSEETEESEDTQDKENTDSEDATKYDREPVVNVDSLKDGSSQTATYTHTKEPVEVSVGDIVTYTLEVFNEGTVDGYASLIKDDIPEGLEFVTYTVGDGSTNDIYRWKMVDENDEEVTDPTKAKYVVSDYLSKENEETENSNLIRAFDKDTMSTLDSKYVKVAFRVVCKQDYPKIITNEAQISEDSDESGKGVKDRDSVPNEWNGEDDEDVEHVKVTYMDLALRKFITGVNDQNVTSRIPEVDAKALIEQTGTTAKYTHTKEPVLVHTTDVVTYTLRVYNEGSKDGYATQIKDDIPEGLVFLSDNETNKQYEWVLVDENDNPVDDISKAKYVVTNYLSKDNETKDRNNLMKAFDPETMETPEYKDVKIAFKVVEPTTSDRILINYAQISEQTDGKGVHREDRDSIPNEWNGEDDEDIEKVRVQYFDLALRKWVTKSIVIQDGKEVVTETGHHAEDDPEDVVKVDLKKSKIDSVVVKFEYQIRITNQGEIAGYAKEIKDYIPNGLKFEQADNTNWTQVSENVIVTDQLKDTLLQPGESTEVTVVLTWINSETNLGLKVNVAEISKDHNDYETPDIDSTPDNYVDGEDDIDDAPVMLTVKTGKQELNYIVITLAALLILGLGVSLIKDLGKKNKA